MARRRTKRVLKADNRSSPGDSKPTECLKGMEPEAQAFLVRRTRTPMKIFASDNLDSSQSDVCEVEWDSRSPITMTQAARYKNQSVDITELVKNYAEERERVSRTPPLVGLWMDHSSDNDEGTSGLRYRAQRLQRGKRGRGRPSGLKMAVSSKEMLLQLESVLKTKPDEDPESSPIQTSGNPQRKSTRIAAQKSGEATVSTSSSSTSPSDNSFELFEASHVPVTSTQKLPTRLLPHCETFKARSTLPHSPILKVNKSPLSENLRQNGLVGNVTPKRPKGDGGRDQCGNLADSLEDLWTDEDLFDDDSFIIKATQGAFDEATTPRSLKRKTPLSSPEVTSVNKYSRYTFKIGSATKEKVKKAGVSADLPFRSYSKSPARKIASDAPQTKTDEFSFVKPLAGISQIETSSNRNGVSRRANQQHPRSAGSPNSYQKSASSRILCTSSTERTEKISTSKKSSLHQNQRMDNKGTAHGASVAEPSTCSHSSDYTRCKTKMTERAQTCAPLKHPKKSFLLDHKENGGKHSTPQRIGKLGAMDTSLTDELLASLAEPDDILDSQMTGAELLDSQSYRDVLSLSPEKSPDGEDKQETLAMETTSHLPPVAISEREVLPKPAAVKKTYQLVDESQDLFADDGFDDFMGDDDDEALSEPQLLAMLDIVESQASQEKKSNPRPSPTKSKAVKTNSEMHAGTSSEPLNLLPVAPPVRKEHIVIGSVCRAGPVIPHQAIPQPVPPARNMAPKPEPVLRTASSAAASSSLKPGCNSAKSSQESQTTSSQKYSKEEIERKKQEALKRRQNRLKLGGIVR